MSTEEREPFPLENFPGAAPSLAEHLLEQLRHAACDGAVRTAGEAIIGNLDDNGYLRAELAEVATATGTSAATVARALALVQTFDPTGVAARDLRECLVLQLRADPACDPLAIEIVAHHCEALGGRRYEHLARALRAPLPRILAATERIRRLDPKPGRAFGGAEARSVVPEVTVEKIDGEYVVILNDQGLPGLRVARGVPRAPCPALRGGAPVRGRAAAGGAVVRGGHRASAADHPARGGGRGPGAARLLRSWPGTPVPARST